MKTSLFTLILLAGTAGAQPVPVPPDVFPSEPFPPEPMPEPGMMEPGFPGGMFFDGIPDRYQIVPTQVQVEGKAQPLVLKIDTMTGQVWQLQITLAQVLRNGRAQTEAKYQFVPITTLGGEGGGPGGAGGARGVFPPGLNGGTQPFNPPPLTLPTGGEINEGTPLRLRVPASPTAP